MGAHPRSRGENGLGRPGLVWDGGSSPLTRGKHRGRARGANRPGRIPAHAGKTAAHTGAGSKLRAHPRSRGENETAEGIEIEARGASPLTRGKPMTPAARPALSGRIPAHAGKTMEVVVNVAMGEAHPRSRGENGARYRRAEGTRGASPLTRGKPGTSAWAVRPTGRIPAHAGKTSGGRSWSVPTQAHPRSRGENSRT